MRQGLGLTRAGTGDDQQWAGADAAFRQWFTVGGGGLLRRIQWRRRCGSRRIGREAGVHGGWTTIGRVTINTDDKTR